MTTRATLLALASRVEAATGADRELDALVAAACRVTMPKGCDWALQFPKWEGAHGGEVRIIGNVNGNGDYIAGTFKALCYTASLDAAMSLVPSGQMQVVDLTLGWNADDPKEWPAVTVRWYPPGNTGNDWHAMIVTAATPALALTAACLRARAMLEQDNG